MPSEDTDAYDVVDDHGARRRRAIITFAIVALLLFFAFWYALSYIRADDARRAQPSAGRSPMCTLEPADITVNVLNGTKREGLAASVSGNLRKRGFVIGTVGNAKSAAAGVGELRFGPSAGDHAKVVARHVGAAKQVQLKREGAKVDIVLGKDFTQLVPLSEARGC